MHICNMCVSCAHRSEKRASDPLELGSWVVTGTIWVLRIEHSIREAIALDHRAISPAQFLEISITVLMTNESETRVRGSYRNG